LRIFQEASTKATICENLETRRHAKSPRHHHKRLNVRDTTVKPGKYPSTSWTQIFIDGSADVEAVASTFATKYNVQYN
jgi:hypothetical protein